MRRMDVDDRCCERIRAGIAGMTKLCGRAAPIEVGKRYYCAVHAAKARARLEAQQVETKSSEDGASP